MLKSKIEFVKNLLKMVIFKRIITRIFFSTKDYSDIVYRFTDSNLSEG
jgi:hypothetical protein